MIDELNDKIDKSCIVSVLVRFLNSEVHKDLGQSNYDFSTQFTFFKNFLLPGKSVPPESPLATGMKMHTKKSINY